VLHYGAGLFPREAAWRSLCAVGRLPDGRPLALHLSEGLPGAAPDDGGECVLLLGDGPARLPQVSFQADPRSPTAPWRIASPGGVVDLTFRPVASHREVRELLLVALRTTQLAGELSGQVPGPDGGSLRLEGVPALVEDLAARW